MSTINPIVVRLIDELPYASGAHKPQSLVIFPRLVTPKYLRCYLRLPSGAVVLFLGSRAVGIVGLPCGRLRQLGHGTNTMVY